MMTVGKIKKVLRDRKMVFIINNSIDSFLKDISDKKLFLFGAGNRAKYAYEMYQLQGRVNAIVDNSKSLKGTSVRCGAEDISIIDVNALCKEVKSNGIENIVVLITPVFYSWAIIEQLDKIEEFNGMRCYIGRFLEDYYEPQEFEFTQSTAKIPKKIHYCWFGHNKIPEHLQKYMESWKKMCPDYEIIRWDESNYDVTQNQYMYEAYKAEKWGFVPDYARLDIIYREGGIYLDTDVELVDSLDSLLNNQAFFGFAGCTTVNAGLGFGAIKGKHIIGAMRDYYNDKSFYTEKKNENLNACDNYQRPVFLQNGFRMDGRHQIIDDVVLYPAEVLNPTGISGGVKHFTDKTCSIHHTELSWATREQRQVYNSFKKNIEVRLSNQNRISVS